MQYVNSNPPLKGICTSVNKASDTVPTFIIGASCDGTNWYRKLSDGVVIQGGYIGIVPAENKTSKSVQFIKPYTTSDISIMLTTVFDSKATASYQGAAFVCGNVYSDSFYIGISGTSSDRLSGCYWEAYGI